RVAWATQPAFRRIQPELAALMRADARDRLNLGIGPVDEPPDRAEVERECSPLGEVDTGPDRVPGTRVGFEHTLGWRRGLRWSRLVPAEQVTPDHDPGGRRC